MHACKFRNRHGMATMPGVYSMLNVSHAASLAVLNAGNAAVTPQNILYPAVRWLVCLRCSSQVGKHGDPTQDKGAARDKLARRLEPSLNVSLHRNKSKYEYTLQGWKAFALSHSVRSGDRLQIELLPDGRRMRADIVKRASPKERASADAGPASPAVVDVASVAKPSSGAASHARTRLYCDPAQASAEGLSLPQIACREPTLNVRVQQRWGSCIEIPWYHAADDRSGSTSGEEAGRGLVEMRGRRTSLGSDSSNPQHGSAGAGPARCAGADRDPRHISSALLQHASEQLNRHLDRGASGHFNSEHLCVWSCVLLCNTMHVHHRMFRPYNVPSSGQFVPTLAGPGHGSKDMQVPCLDPHAPHRPKSSLEVSAQ